MLQYLLRLIRSPSRVIDRLFGYDVFVAHRRADAAAYAALLVKRLDEEKLSTFIDTREYGPGDELSASTLRHIRKATMLVVLGSPLILQSRDPDWVLAEVDAYFAANRGEALRVLPISFGGALAGMGDQSAIVARLRDVIRLEQPLAALQDSPSSEVIEAITRQFRNRRRDMVRLRVFQGIAAVLFALLAASLAAAWLANRALNDARQNLAANYMTAARARLASGFRDEAAALAAESMRHADKAEARRLITENPPLDLSHVSGAAEVSAFAIDVDFPRHRLAAAGFEGRLSLIGTEAGRESRSDVRLGKVDLWAVRFTPDGERLIVGDDRGTMHVRAVGDLERPACDALPVFSDRISRLEFLPVDRGLLTVAGKAAYVVGFKDGCPSGAPREIYRSANDIVEAAYDSNRERIVIAEVDGLVSVTLANGEPGPPQRFALPVRPGQSDRAQPTHFALHPQTGKLCVLTLGGDELLFLDQNFGVVAPLGQRPFGDEDPLRVTQFGFDQTGERLVILDGDGQLLIWSVAEGRALRRVRIHAQSNASALLPDDTLLSLGSERLHAGDWQQVLRVVQLDSPLNAPVRLMGSDATAEPRVRSLETSPAGDHVLAAASGGHVLSFDLASRKVSDLGRLGASVEWVARAADGKRIAFFGNGANVGIWESDRLLREASFREQVPTGLRSATWLDDGTALVVGGGWTSPLLLPADRRERVRAGPVAASNDIRRMIAGPNGKVLISESFSTWIWDTARDTTLKVDLVGRADLALTDVARRGRNEVAALTRNGLFLWRWRSDGTLERSAEVRIGGDQMVVNADGRRIAIFNRGELAVYDLPSGELRAMLPFVGGDVYTAAFSEDAAVLLGGSRSAPLVLWSLFALDAPRLRVADSTQRASGRVGADFALELPVPMTQRPMK